MNKTEVIILSDPKNGGEEALGRLFNALATAYDIKQSGYNVSIVFQGTGTRWPSLITQQDHPAHTLYQELKDNMTGASKGCAEIFDADQDVVKSGFDLISEASIPGTSGVPSAGKLLESKSNILVF